MALTAHAHTHTHTHGAATRLISGTTPTAIRHTNRVGARHKPRARGPTHRVPQPHTPLGANPVLAVLAELAVLAVMASPEVLAMTAKPMARAALSESSLVCATTVSSFVTPCCSKPNHVDA